MLEKIEEGRIYIDEFGGEWEAIKFLPSTLQWIFGRLVKVGYTPVALHEKEWQKLKPKTKFKTVEVFVVYSDIRKAPNSLTFRLDRTFNSYQEALEWINKQEEARNYSIDKLFERVLC